MNTGSKLFSGANSQTQLNALARLRWQWMGLAGLVALFLAAGYRLQATWESAGNALSWLLVSGSLAGFMLWTLWSYLEDNHRAGEAALLPDLGLANLFTFGRGILLAALAGYLVLSRPQGWQAWMPGLLYTCAALMDFADGYLARVRNHASRLGERLDMNLDGIGVLVAATLAVRYGQVPGWYLLVGLARYLWLAAIWLRKQSGKPLDPLPPSYARRAMAGLQMGFIFVMLMPLFSPPGTYLAASLIAAPFLAWFVRDWLVVTRIIRPQPRLPARWVRYFKRWLPVALRLAVVILMAGLVYQRVNHMDRLTGLGMAEITAALLIGLGAAGRVGAILALCLLGVAQMSAALNPNQIMLVVLDVTLLYMGSGAWSLWKPEDYWITHRAGER